MCVFCFFVGLWWCVFVWMFLLVGFVVQGVEFSKLECLCIVQVFFVVEWIGDFEGDYGVCCLSKGEEIFGYVFQIFSVIDILVYFGKLINLQVIFDLQVVICDVYVFEYYELILLIGILEEKLYVFSVRYDGVCVDQWVVVGCFSDLQVVIVDVVSGVMVIVMVVNEIVMCVVYMVVVFFGLIEDCGNVWFKLVQVCQ